jgi:hypothetical protein
MAPGGGVPPCDRVCSRPLESNTLCEDASMSACFQSVKSMQSLTFFFAPCAEPELLTRLRLLITSVFRLIGRGLPCSLRNRPQALQSTEPISSRRQRGVVEVVQFWHVGCVVSRSLAAIVADIVKCEIGEFIAKFDCDKEVRDENSENEARRAA